MEKVKKCIICKGIDQYSINKKIKREYIPVAGDVAIFKVLEIGKHSSIQGVNGNNSYLFPGDIIMAAFGNRYATDQFEGYVPLRYHNEYHILGKGGAVGILKSMHVKLEDKGTTNLRLIGYVTNKEGKVINTKYIKHEPLAHQPYKNHKPSVILSLGSSMDSGKTTTAAFLSRGLMAAKKKVAYIKLTGTVYTKDRHFVRDCGAHMAIDFSTFGFPSTYMCDLPELLDLFENLMARVNTINPDYVVIEIADGLLQRETKMLLESPAFRSHVDDVIFSAADSLGILSGLNLLEQYGVKPFAVSGLFTASPLLINEVEQAVRINVQTLEDLSSPEILKLLNKISLAAA